MDNLAHHWMVRQQQAGLRLCLVLDGTNEACQSLLAVRSVSQYCRFYAQTSLADLAAEGPVVLLLDHVGEPALLSLLRTPQMNWGWLGSVASAELSNLAQHWRDRLLVGPQGDQALYRFYDNRTLARALDHLAPEQWPPYLGPLISVCYWHEQRWHSADNAAPGEYPVPEPAPWLSTPNPQADAILHANILRYLLAEHSEDLAALFEFQDPKVWLAQVLEQARAWQWNRPEQLEFLVVRRLEEATRASKVHWLPMAGELPEDHFQRVVKQWRSMEKADE
ncbi:hypothetical protein HNP03_004957 [Pseudomonas rhodesiae]|jgi:hypothetical protein|uniref:DUF4123 domain-containing protein n=1 Tax=Pseudomonas rhodesiae TaxID=76760 RepID=UPI00160966FD|nr:DUF4123 domain-containing protein [Pseudomonas rhodesiae]MBB4816288.1 hypothetical protein [Pseudomonas rhodesiae]